MTNAGHQIKSFIDFSTPFERVAFALLELYRTFSILFMHYLCTELIYCLQKKTTRMRACKGKWYMCLHIFGIFQRSMTWCVSGGWLANMNIVMYETKSQKLIDNIL